MTEILVTIYMRFPLGDSRALAEHIEPVAKAALAAGGLQTDINVQQVDDGAFSRDESTGAGGEEAS